MAEIDIVYDALTNWKPYSGFEGLAQALDDAEADYGLEGDNPRIPIWVAPFQAENLNREGGDGYEYFYNDGEVEKDNTFYKALNWLCETQGYTLNDLEDGTKVNNSTFLRSLTDELAVGAINGVLILYGNIHYQDLTDLAHNNRTFHAPADITVGAFDPTFGGGSLLGVELEKGVDVPVDLSQYISEIVYSGQTRSSYGYSVSDVYGTNPSDLSDFIIK